MGPQTNSLQAVHMLEVGMTAFLSLDVVVNFRCAAPREPLGGDEGAGAGAGVELSQLVLPPVLRGRP